MLVSVSLVSTVKQPSDRLSFVYECLYIKSSVVCHVLNELVPLCLIGAMNDRRAEIARQARIMLAREFVVVEDRHPRGRTCNINQHLDPTGIIEYGNAFSPKFLVVYPCYHTL
jgi:hypothetical protein